MKLRWQDFLVQSDDSVERFTGHLGGFECLLFNERTYGLMKVSGTSSDMV